MCWSTPCKHLLVQLESLINFTSYLFYFSWKPEAQVKPPLPSSSSKEETISSSPIQCWVGLVITEQEKYQMGLLRNNFISSWTLRKLSLIPSSLLDPRRLEYFTPTIPYLPHSTHRIIMEMLLYFRLSNSQQSLLGAGILNPFYLEMVARIV